MVLQRRHEDLAHEAQDARAAPRAREAEEHRGAHARGRALREAQEPDLRAGEGVVGKSRCTFQRSE